MAEDIKTEFGIVAKVSDLKDQYLVFYGTDPDYPKRYAVSIPKSDLPTSKRAHRKGALDELARTLCIDLLDPWE